MTFVEQSLHCVQCQAWDTHFSEALEALHGHTLLTVQIFATSKMAEAVGFQQVVSRRRLPSHILAFPDNSGCIWENEWVEHVVLTLSKTLRFDPNPN